MFGMQKHHYNTETVTRLASIILTVIVLIALASVPNQALAATGPNRCEHLFTSTKLSFLQRTKARFMSVLSRSQPQQEPPSSPTTRNEKSDTNINKPKWPTFEEFQQEIKVQELEILSRSEFIRATPFIQMNKNSEIDFISELSIASKASSRLHELEKILARHGVTKLVVIMRISIARHSRDYWDSGVLLLNRGSLTIDPRNLTSEEKLIGFIENVLTINAAQLQAHAESLDMGPTVNQLATNIRELYKINIKLETNPKQGGHWNRNKKEIAVLTKSPRAGSIIIHEITHATSDRKFDLVRNRSLSDPTLIRTAARLLIFYHHGGPTNPLYKGELGADEVEARIKQIAYERLNPSSDTAVMHIEREMALMIHTQKQQIEMFLAAKKENWIIDSSDLPKFQNYFSLSIPGVDSAIYIPDPYQKSDIDHQYIEAVLSKRSTVLAYFLKTRPHLLERFLPSTETD